MNPLWYARDAVRDLIGLGLFVVCVAVSGAMGFMLGEWSDQVELVTIPGPTVTVKAKPPAKAKDKVQTGVRVGKFCYPLGAHGVTAQQQHVRCLRMPPDNLGRWRG